MEATSGSLALHLLGIARAHEGRYEKAEEAFLGAVKADPEMADSYVELGLVYACHGEYRKMVEALRRAVAVGGVRAYLGGRPLGEIPVNAAANTKANGGGLPALVTAMAHLAEGRDAEAAGMLEQFLENKPGSPPLLVALLALTYLLQGDDVEADAPVVRRVTVAAEGYIGDR